MNDDVEYPVRDRPYCKGCFYTGRKAALEGKSYRNPYDHFATPTFWRGWMLGYQSVYGFGT